MQQETTIGRIPEASRAAQIGNSLAWTLAALLAFAPGVTGQSQSASAGQVSSVSTAVVTSGTRFLVKLDDKLSTRKDKVGKKFDLKTLEPLIAANGAVIPPGAKIRGHVSRIEPAGFTGRARLWLSFDEINTREGKLPIVAHVLSVPEEHSVKAGESKEGEIEARTSKGKPEVEAAAAGAAIGAVIGATSRSGKGAGIGAAIGGATGFLIASGMGMELELQKGTKLELELSRPLYVEKW
ncbi:MAG TPA: hypothetical protein VGQ11_10230 [Candidatus Acidoferrales bacterium]|nr:hypothetical protein [Candidatus Acidoferrales bacterium]